MKPRLLPISKLILASSSPFRQQLLQRLNVTFECVSPDIDESAVHGEAPETQVMRLARNKAHAVAARHPDTLIVGSDQLASCAGQVFGKPGGHQRAILQLRQMAGESLYFHTGLCLLNSRTGREQLDCVVYRVSFRCYTDAEIERYLSAEQPYNCSGSFRSEGLGISLVESMQGPDPSALIGLPLIRLADMLRQEGLEIP